MTHITRKDLNEALDNLCRASGDALGRHVRAAQAALDRRDVRIGELEARIAALEGRAAPGKPRVRVPALRAVA